MSDDDDTTVEPRNRRVALAALVGLGAVAAAAATVKPAKAGGLSMSDVTGGVDNASITGMIESMISISGSISIPTTGMEIMRCLFDALHLSWSWDACSSFKSYWSMQTAADLPRTMQELWSTDPALVDIPTIPSEMDESTQLHHLAASEQVMESQVIAAQTAAAQGALTAEDMDTVAAIAGAAEEGYLIAVVGLLGLLIQGTNVRLSQLIMQGNAAQQTRGAALMAETYKPALAAAYRDKVSGAGSVDVGGANQL